MNKLACGELVIVGGRERGTLICFSYFSNESPDLEHWDLQSEDIGVL